jgi:tellurite methyltransferase
MTESFEDQYKKEDCYWGLNPHKFVSEALKLKKSGSVLDLGVGEGRNAIFLAKNGFDVTGIDVSETGIKRFLELSEGLKVKGIVEDIKKFEFIQGYDIILSIATLHFLEREEIEKIIQKIKNHTNENGLNIISIFTEDNPSKGFPYLFKKNELRDFYKDWRILEYEEYLSPLERHGDSHLHRHSVASILAQKTI